MHGSVYGLVGGDGEWMQCVYNPFSTLAKGYFQGLSIVYAAVGPGESQNPISRRNITRETPM